MPFDPSMIHLDELDAMIAEAKAQETELFAAIGKRVWLAALAAGEDLPEEAGELGRIGAKIALCEAIRDAVSDSPLLCRSCGKALLGGVSFCPFCGSAVEEEAEA